jgi:hypothetical protein
MYIHINDTITMFEILNNSLLKVYYNGDLNDLNELSFSWISFILKETGITLNQYIGYSNFNKAFGFKNGLLCVDYIKNLDSICCDFEENVKLEEINGRLINHNDKKYINQQQVNTFIDLFSLNLNVMNENFSFNKEDEYKIFNIIKSNMHYEYNNLKDILFKLDETIFYKYFIYNKYPENKDEKYNFKNLLKETCIEEKIILKDVTILTLEEITLQNIDPIDVPDSIYEMLIVKDYKNIISGSHKNLYTDIKKQLLYSDIDRDWSSIINKYAIKTKDTLQMIKKEFDQTLFYQQPYAFTIYFPQISEKFVDEFFSFYIKNSENLLNLSLEIINKEGRNIKSKFTMDTVKQFIYLLQYSSTHEGSNSLHKLFIKSVEMIFDNDYIYHDFESYKKDTEIMSGLNIDRSYKDDFIRLLMTCICNSIKSETCDSRDLFNKEKEAASLEGGITHSKPYNKLINSENLLDIFQKGTTQKHGKHILHFIRRKIDSSKGYILPQLTFSNNLIINDTEDNEEEIEEMMEDMEYIETYEIEEVKEMMQDAYKNHKKLFKKSYPKEKINEEGIHLKVDYFTSIGSVSILRLISNHKCFILLTLNLPTDINLTNNQYTKIYNVPLVSKNLLLPNCAFMITHNLNGIDFYNYTKDKGKFLDYINYAIDEDGNMIYCEKDTHATNILTEFMQKFDSKIEEEIIEEEIIEHNKDNCINHIDNYLKNKNNMDEKVIYEICTDKVLNKKYKHEKIPYPIKKKIIGERMKEVFKNRPNDKIIKLFYEWENNLINDNDTLTKGLEDILNSENNLTDIKIKHRLKSMNRDYNRYTPISDETKLYQEIKTLFSDLTPILMNREIYLEEKSKHSLLDQFSGLLSRVEDMKDINMSTLCSNYIELLIILIEDSKIGELLLEKECKQKLEDIYQDCYTALSDIFGSEFTNFKRRSKKHKYVLPKNPDFDIKYD